MIIITNDDNNNNSATTIMHNMYVYIYIMMDATINNNPTINQSINQPTNSLTHPLKRIPQSQSNFAKFVPESSSL